MPEHQDAAAANQPDLRDIGDRIDTLLDAAASGGVVARERAEELVRLVTNLYGAGLERLLDLLYDAGRLDPEMLEVLAGDELVSGLLLIHGLHPLTVDQRVERALELVRPYLASHGGDVELTGVSDDAVKLRLLGSCDGCPSSAVTLELAVKNAIESAAPEIARIDVEQAASPGPATGPLIPVASLRTRLDQPDSPGTTWHRLTAVPDLGALGTMRADGVPLIVCRLPDGTLLAFRDRCPRCEAALGGGLLVPHVDGSGSEPLLACPSCGAHFDVRRAGTCIDVPDLHLEPFPVLGAGAEASVALPAGAPA